MARSNLFSQFSRLARFYKGGHQSTRLSSFDDRSRYNPSGALHPEPKKTPFGLLGILCMVVPGLFIGAAISKYMANFLEENELFVPSDDDDDDD